MEQTGDKDIFVKYRPHPMGGCHLRTGWCRLVQVNTSCYGRHICGGLDRSHLEVIIKDGADQRGCQQAIRYGVAQWSGQEWTRVDWGGPGISTS